MQSNLEALWQPLQSAFFQKAAQHKDILFPVFTNGTCLQSKYLDLFDKNRNLIPIISIEGDEKTTDERIHLAPSEEQEAFIRKSVKKLRKKKEIWFSSLSPVMKKAPAAALPRAEDSSILILTAEQSPARSHHIRI